MSLVDEDELTEEIKSEPKVSVLVIHFCRPTVLYLGVRITIILLYVLISHMSRIWAGVI